MTGCLISSRTAFILDLFLENQKAIQAVYPASFLVLATNEEEFASVLEGQLQRKALRGEVIVFKNEKRAGVQSRLWDIAAGRESLRRHFLGAGASFYLSVDADMLFDPDLIKILLDRRQGADVVFSGYQARTWNTLTYGAGCLLIGRDICRKITFHCLVFSDRLYFQEDELFEAEAFQAGARIRKGIFLNIRHYRDRERYFAIEPQRVSRLRAFTTSAFFRFALIRLEVLIRFRLADWFYIRILGKRAVTD